MSFHFSQGPPSSRTQNESSPDEGAMTRPQILNFPATGSWKLKLAWPPLATVFFAFVPAGTAR